MKLHPTWLVAAVLAAAAAPASANVLLVDLSADANGQWGPLQYCGVPYGAVVLGGTPFLIADDHHGHAINYAASGPPVALTVPVSFYGARTVDTLINTNAGAPGVYQVILFTGTGGASYVKPLDGNVDVRDWNNDGYTNSINGTTTMQVWSSGQSRLDRQAIALPSSFYNQTLTSVTFIDFGYDYPHSNPPPSRLILTGLTIAGVPEPATWAAMLAGFGGIGAVLRSRRRSAAESPLEPAPASRPS